MNDNLMYHFVNQIFQDRVIVFPAGSSERREPRDKPFDLTPFDLTQGLRQGDESFDYAVRP
jgi:hypothetical protein